MIPSSLFPGKENFGFVIGGVTKYQEPNINISGTSLQQWQVTVVPEYTKHKDTLGTQQEAGAFEAMRFAIEILVTSALRLDVLTRLASPNCYKSAT